jgi:glutaredoxin|tara:strand:- start:420 stop:611 length:192 start_codon:yes stop_codon:yes gene_type:complete
MAKKLLESRGQEYTEIAIDKDNEAKNYVKGFAKTVPQIFLGEQLIGGYQELSEHVQHLHLYKS